MQFWKPLQLCIQKDDRFGLLSNWIRALAGFSFTFKRIYNPTDSTSINIRKVIWKPLSEFHKISYNWHHSVMSVRIIFSQPSKNKANLEIYAVLLSSTFCLQYCSFNSNTDIISLTELILIFFSCNFLFNILIICHEKECWFGVHNNHRSI